jgi:hypothetical protein
MTIRSIRVNLMELVVGLPLRNGRMTLMSPTKLAGVHFCLLFSIVANTLLSAVINKEFPWYDDLHAMWRDNPAYNPLVVMNVKNQE